MFYFDNTRTIKEQLKDVKISIPKILILLLADIILITFGSFLVFIGAKVIGLTLIIITIITSLFIPVGKLKSKPNSWTVMSNNNRQ